MCKQRPIMLWNCDHSEAINANLIHSLDIKHRIGYKRTKGQTPIRKDSWELFARVFSGDEFSSLFYFGVCDNEAEAKAWLNDIVEQINNA